MKILEPYRRRIDELDDKIVRLLAERIGIIREVGVLKARENIPAVLPDRVEEVRARAASRAADLGVDPDFISRLYTMLISYSCDLEDVIKAERAATKKAIGD